MPFLAKFAFGIPVGERNPERMPQFQFNGHEVEIKVFVDQTRMVFYPEVSKDLINWTDLPSFHSNHIRHVTVTRILPDDNYRFIRIRIGF